MSIFELLTLVGEPPGSFVYHLVLLFTLALTTAIAVNQWLEKRNTESARLALGASALFLLRLALLAVTLLAAVSILDPLISIPPLDRAVSTLTILVIIWTFAFPNPNRPADAATAALTLIILLALGITLPLWAQEVAAGASFYNGSLQETGWEIAQIALLLGGILLLTARRKSNWLIGLILLVLLLAGHAIHYLFPIQGGNIPNAERLTEIVALPMFAAMVYRRGRAMMITSVVSPTPADLPRSNISADIPSTAGIGLNRKAAVALASLSGASSPEELTQILPLALAHTFSADVALLVAPPDSSETTSITCGYNLIQDKFLPGTSLPTNEISSIAEALAQDHAVRLDPKRHQAQIQRLSEAVGVDRVGSTLLLPLHSMEDQRPLGGIILISSSPRLRWSEEDQQFAEVLGEPIAAALRASEKMARLNQTAPLVESVGPDGEAAERLQRDLAAARAEAERLTLELDRLQEEMDHQREEAAVLINELKTQQEVETRQAASLSDEIQALQSELQSTSEERDRLETERDAALKRVETLAQIEINFESAAREAEAQTQRALDLAAALERAQIEWQVTSAQTKQETDRLQSELELARQEAQARERLQDELTDAVENLKLQSELAATLQNEISTYKQIELQLRKELDLTRTELKRLLEQNPALLPPPIEGQTSAELQAALDEKSKALTDALEALAQAQSQLAEKEQASAPSTDIAPAEALDPSKPIAPFSGLSNEVVISLVQELRQPMSSIVGYSDLLLGESVGILGALQRKFLERIIASCERMEALLDDLIRVTALDAGKLKLAHDSLDVMSVIEDAILGCSAQLREKGINLRLHMADELPVVLADRDALRQIVSHLLNNAGSASVMNGEVTLNVGIQHASTIPDDRRRTNGLFISVRDSGGGIAPEDQPRVFSRKYRADAPLITGLGDTGVGLFIAKALTEAQGGRIWVNSELGLGSTFYVLLPIEDQPLQAGGNGSNPLSD